jgi:hypothetical protein
VKARVRRLVLGSAASASVFACVDLFHSTDFVTLCSADAAACSPSPEASAPSGEEAAAPEAGPVDFCSLSLDDAEARAERACAWMGACLGGAIAQGSFARCVFRARAMYDCQLNPGLRPHDAVEDFWRCLANISSCGDVKRCLYGNSDAGPPHGCGFQDGLSTQCASGPSSGIVQCAPGGANGAANPPAGVEECFGLGQACTVASSTTAVCAGSENTHCTGTRPCEGSFAVKCYGTVDIGRDCSAFGGRACFQDSAGPACAPVEGSPACPLKNSKLECDDAGTAHSCVNGFDVRIDCARLALPCHAETLDSGIDPLLACAETDASAGCFHDDRCDGDTLTSCAQGRTFQVNCGAVGLGACALAGAPRVLAGACTLK